MGSTMTAITNSTSLYNRSIRSIDLIMFNLIIHFVADCFQDTVQSVNTFWYSLKWINLPTLN
ncbi:hypothetical protein BLOT_000340 [Blomia tropicalis]|nr:hypothetical protein BLOT_000340 [Blomia tropicalis]